MTSKIKLLSTALLLTALSSTAFATAQQCQDMYLGKTSAKEDAADAAKLKQLKKQLKGLHDSEKTLEDRINGTPLADAFVAGMTANMPPEARYKKAFELCALASTDPLAQYWLGVMFIRGEGVDKDEKEGISWLTKSADHGDVHAQRFLGLVFKGSKDIKQSIEWYTKASNQGDSFSSYELGGLYMFKTVSAGIVINDSVEKTDKSYSEDYRHSQEALVWFNKALEQRSNTSLLTAPQADLSNMIHSKVIGKVFNRMGKLYYLGEGADKDLKKAFELQTKSAELGNVDGIAHLGAAYQYGDGVDKDLARAYALFIVADKLGHSKTSGYASWLKQNDLGAVGAIQAKGLIEELSAQYKK